jgi:hypothetical protein
MQKILNAIAFFIARSAEHDSDSVIHRQKPEARNYCSRVRLPDGIPRPFSRGRLQALQHNLWKKVIPTYGWCFCNFLETPENGFRAIFTAAGWLMPK